MVQQFAAFRQIDELGENPRWRRHQPSAGEPKPDNELPGERQTDRQQQTQQRPRIAMPAAGRACCQVGFRSFDGIQRHGSYQNRVWLTIARWLPQAHCHPLPLWERVVSSVSEKPGEGFWSIERDPSPGSNFAVLILATLSHKGRGEGPGRVARAVQRKVNSSAAKRHRR
jgi:hypothetical protein